MPRVPRIRPLRKHVKVRRYMAYLERSIERDMQWVVFEPNDSALWKEVQARISDFLHAEWRSGALVGVKPEEAFFVRCDRTTMSQSDLDAGRLVCLVGVAVLRPAEFMILSFRHATADLAPGSQSE